MDFKSINAHLDFYPMGILRRKMLTETSVIDPVEHQGKTSHHSDYFLYINICLYANEKSSCSGNNARL